ncbi:LacI family DNA-binding transcriptional regulator [Candidatus Galacturonibacter soehngenii]|uniref:LacI family transcriptional regulator n=1 Tax=Candidatus Galacturonatibacter soehngenii TaxID=2307010 RepID=A0A7V7QKI9_9FIRM|nr:LacI family DNA-binding transcriptional regulator [Candidatus Galacturonibacter soehngenii]KAB1438325.1 LacI family transcriptional regulator [Candidatus Galacturonibacter soehngenii]MBA4688566.1 LacI family DNA-binding transcriptional regulator [Candidatus Galacturonibacter soehngenii]
MATLKDVAKETGLAVSTVSRVLNSRGYISEETKKSVYDAMKKLNYQPNEVARSLSKQTTNTIGVIVPHIKHPYFAELISHIEAAANHRNYKILLFNSRDRDEKEKEILDMCNRNRVAGIILCSGTVEMNKFEGIHVPLITIERNLEMGTAAVECDNLKGGRMAARHLIEKGCTNLAVISGVRGNYMPADDREIGFMEVCKECGITYQAFKTNEVQYNMGEYHELIEEVLTQNKEVDGIFASSDLIAAQVLQVCSRLKISVPKDLKVVGFDDVLVSSITTPTITTIHQPIKEMAQMAISMLVDASKDKMVASKTTLPVSLVEREST